MSTTVGHRSAPVVEERRRAAAYHEAGHAAAHLWLHIPIAWATIAPGEGTDGGVMGRPMTGAVVDWIAGGCRRPAPAPVRDRIEREVMTLRAGDLAQQKGTGTSGGTMPIVDHPDHGTVLVGGDNHRILDLLGWLGGSHLDEVDAELRARTVELLDEEDVWATVEAITTELLAHTTLTEHHLRQIKALVVGEVVR